MYTSRRCVDSESPGWPLQKPRAGWLGTGIANLITDVVIFSVAVVWVVDLQMSLHNKITVNIQLFIGAMYVPSIPHWSSSNTNRIISSVTIISFVFIFFVLKSDPSNVTGSVVNPDILSCIELNMAIVFASVSGIAGREAISNFAHRFIVQQSTSYGVVYRADSTAVRTQRVCFT